MLEARQQDNLYKAFGLFIEVIRPYIVNLLEKEAGERWPAWFVEALVPQQRENWKKGIRSGSEPTALIDYPYLRNFAIKYKDLLRKDFGQDVNNLATYFGDIYAVRNKLAHFQEINDDEYDLTFIQMKRIARAIGEKDLEEILELLKENVSDEVGIQRPETAAPDNWKWWFKVVRPHLDIQQGRLDESVFAANLAEVALGNGREIYRDWRSFFEKTYFTAGLKNVARTVIRGLNGNEEAENRVISLQTGFGGGKTHTLISLYHLARWGKQVAESNYAKELVAYTGAPEFEGANIAVFTNATNDPANGRVTEDGIHIQTIWGDLAYQLGGKEAYEIVRLNDQELISPAGRFRQVLERCTPALILIDELADYCVKASAKVVGTSTLAEQTISFMQELTEAVAGTNQCVAVITLPLSDVEVGNTDQAQVILNALQKRVSRVGADTKPVEDEEIYEVVRRRLFENVGAPEVIEKVADQYMELYRTYGSELPEHVTRTEYKQKLMKSYPFHPELIDIFRIRWGSHHDFQRTRGVLRLLAAIVNDLWKRQHNLVGENILIHPGSVNFANLDALSGQLKKLYGNGYDSVIDGDVAGGTSNAFRIDSRKTEYGNWNLTQSIAAVILLNSFGSEGANRGVSIKEIKLSLLTPNGFNHNNVNGALDEFENNAYYLHYAQLSASGKRYWFLTKPNINILVTQARNDVKEVDIMTEVLDRLKQGTRNVQLFTVLVNPTSDVPEQLNPTLIFLSPYYQATKERLVGDTAPYIEKLATKKGNSERIFRNTILFVVCSELGIAALRAKAQEYLACRQIEQEYKSQLDAEQKQDIARRIDSSSKELDKAIVTAYTVVVKYMAKNDPEILYLEQAADTMEQQINTNLVAKLKDEELFLESVGYNLLRVNNLLPSAQEDVSVKKVYESFLRYDDKPMISGKEAVSNALKRYCMDGHFAIASRDETGYTHYYFKKDIPYFDVTDETYWLVDVSKVPQPAQPENGNPGGGQGGSVTPITPPAWSPVTPPPTPVVSSGKVYKTITISGSVPVEHYTQIFQSFVRPFLHNNVEIEIKIKARSTDAVPLTENSQVVRVVEESVRQLGLRLDTEE